MTRQHLHSQDDFTRVMSQQPHEAVPQMLGADRIGDDDICRTCGTGVHPVQARFYLGLSDEEGSLQVLSGWAHDVLTDMPAQWVAFTSSHEAFGPFEGELEAYQYAYDVACAIDGERHVSRLGRLDDEYREAVAALGWVIVPMDRPDPADFLPGNDS